MFDNLNILIVIGFVIIHLFSKHLTFGKLKLSAVMSFAAGVGLAYIVINLLPQLRHFQEVIDDSFKMSNNIFVANIIYIIILFGFTFSHISHQVDEELYKKYKDTNINKAETLHFWSDMTFHIIYNLLIGYIIISKDFGSVLQFISFFIAFGLHFLMNDWGLRHHHKNRHDKIGRYVLALSMFLGGTISLFVDFPNYVIVIFEAYITGAMILNVVKYELPSETESSIQGLILGIVTASIFFLLS